MFDMYEIKYRQGYERALSDVKNWFERHTITMKNNKLNNEKGIRMIVNAFVENADTFRDYGENTEFILTEDKKKIILGKQIEW